MASRYSPLHRNKAQIRLLRLQPAEKKENSTPWTPECTMFVIDLDDESKPPFNALSYAWGPPDPTGTILLDGHEVRVRQNLLDFLRVAATDTAIRDEFLWIDQVCIDQASIPERNHQVGLMSRIYSKADKVFAWLGNATLESDWAMEVSSTGRSLSSISDIPGLGTLLSRPYWGRLWIIQELILANSLKILCGDKKFDWDMFVESFRLWEIGHWLTEAEKMLSDEHDIPIIKCALHLVDLRRNSGSTYPPSIAALINKFGGSQCSDLRDKVFGLSALVPESDRIQVDYDISLITLFLKINDHSDELVDRFFGGDISANRITTADRIMLQNFRLDEEGDILGDILLSELLETRRVGQNDDVLKLCEEIGPTLLSFENMFSWWTLGQEDREGMQMKQRIVEYVYVVRRQGTDSNQEWELQRYGRTVSWIPHIWTSRNLFKVSPIHKDDIRQRIGEWESRRGPST